MEYSHRKGDAGTVDRGKGTEKEDGVQRTKDKFSDMRQCTEDGRQGTETMAGTAGGRQET